MKEKISVDKPRVAVIGLKGFPAFGGSARAGENMIFYLKKQFHFVVFNTSTHTDRKSGLYDGVEQVVFPRFFFRKFNTLFYYFRALSYCLFKGGFDVVHVFHVDAAFIVPLLRLRYPVIAGHRASPHLADKWNRVIKSYFYFMEWLFFKMPADILTSVSLPVVKTFQPHTRRKIVFIPNGIVLNHETTQLPVIQEQDYVLFASGRIMALKGCHVLLGALSRMKYNGRVLIIGNRDHDLEYAKRLEELAGELNVVFIDIIKDKDLLMAYLKKARVFVFPSFHEGMSNMLLEAVSAKIPVVCSDIPENKQVFDENESLFFKTGDEMDLAEKLQWVFSNPEGAQAVADRGYKRLIVDYNWAKLSQKYAHLYLWLMNNKKPLNKNDNSLQGF